MPGTKNNNELEDFYAPVDAFGRDKRLPQPSNEVKPIGVDNLDDLGLTPEMAQQKYRTPPQHNDVFMSAQPNIPATSDPFMNMNLNPTLPVGSDSPFAGIGDYENALGMGPTVYTGGGGAAPGSAPPPNSSGTKQKRNGPVQG